MNESQSLSPHSRAIHGRSFAGDRRWRERIFAWALPLTLQLAALGFFAAPSSTDGFPLDDAWIHQVVARTFAQTGTLGYLADKFGSGSTSYLWAILLAPNFAWFHVDPVRYALALNIFFWLAAGQTLAWAITKSESSSFNLTRSAVAVAFACCGGNFIWFVFSGMEATLFAALSIVSLALFANLTKSDRRTPILIAASLFALVLTRPEAAGIGILLVAWAWLRGFSRARLAVVLSGWALGVVTYLTVNLAETGHFTPTTLTGRKWVWLDAAAGRSHFSLATDLAPQWADRLMHYTLGVSTPWIFWICVAAAMIGFVEVVRNRVDAISILVAWAFLHLAFYAVMMPAIGHGGRYEPLVPFVFVLLATYGSITVASQIFQAFELARSGALAIGALPCAAVVVAGIVPWRHAEPLAVAHVETTEVGLAKIFNDLPRDAVIASFDIGGAGFFSDRSILDLGGLLDSRVVPFLKERTIATYLREHHVDYVAIPLGYEDAVPDLFNFGYRLHLFENPSIFLEPIAFVKTPEASWLPGIMSTMNSAPRQGVFHVTYRDAPLPTSLLQSQAPFHLADEDALLGTDERAQLEYALRAMSTAGVGIDMRVMSLEPKDPMTAVANVVAVDVGPWGMRARFPDRFSAAPALEIDRMMRDAGRNYARFGDTSGAARESLFLITVAVTRWIDPTFAPILPPTPLPTTKEMKQGSLLTLLGAPFALLIVSAFETMRRRRSHTELAFA